MADDHRFSRIAEIARRMKLEAVRDATDEDEANLPHIIIGYRQGEPKFYAHPELHNPEGPRLTCYWTAACTFADEVFLVIDARFKFNPQDEDIEMGQLSRDWEAGRREGIQECIMIERHPMIGPATMAMYVYEIDGKQLIWKHVSTFDEDKLDGALNDYVKAGFKRSREISTRIRKVMDEGAREAELTLTEQRFHEDRGIARFLSKCDGVGMVQVRTDPPARFIKGMEQDEDD